MRFGDNLPPEVEALLENSSWKLSSSTGLGYIWSIYIFKSNKRFLKAKLFYN